MTKEKATTRPALIRLCVLCASVAVFAFRVWAQSTPVPQQVDPATLAAKEQHEGLLIAVDPYTDAPRSKERFGKKHPQEHGILAVEVFLRNDNIRPIRVDLSTIRLLLSPPETSRQRLEPLDVEDVIERMLYKGGPELTRPRMPIPRRTPNRSKDWKEIEAMLKPALLETDILPPKSTMHGFLFFDVSNHFEWVPYARLYVPKLQFMDNKQELFYFEVDMRKAAQK